VDTLREDYAKYLEDKLKHMGFTPYRNTIAPSPWTVPSHASIFTGNYPAFHRIHETKQKKSMELRFSTERMLLVNRLKGEHGYYTCLISANPFISPHFGVAEFDKDYDISPHILSNLPVEDRRYIQKIKNGKIKLVFKLIKDKRFLLLNKLILLKFKENINEALGISSWPKDKGIRRSARIISSMKFDKPTFVFMNLMEVHEPYTKKEPNAHKVMAENFRKNRVDKELIEIWKKNYPLAVRYVTKNLERILKKINEKGILDSSLVIITSDHGQLFGEHGRIGHGTFLYDELIRVPLFIRYPSKLEIEITAPDESKYVSLTSLTPYILSILDGKINSDEILYNEVVFSESYGIPQTSIINELKKQALSEEEKKNIKQLEKYRIAIYYKNFKGIFNVTDWKFEEIKSYDPNIEVTEDVVKHMKKEVIRFLKTAALAKVPKIKL